MSEKKKLVVVVSNGFNDERSSVALSVANSGINSGLEVTMFLVSAAVDLVRKGAAAVAQLNPLDPTLGEMLDNFIAAGGKVLIEPVSLERATVAVIADPTGAPIGIAQLNSQGSRP